WGPDCARRRTPRAAPGAGRHPNPAAKPPTYWRTGALSAAMPAPPLAGPLRITTRHHFTRRIIPIDTAVSSSAANGSVPQIDAPAPQACEPPLSPPATPTKSVPSALSITIVGPPLRPSSAAVFTAGWSSTSIGGLAGG